MSRADPSWSLWRPARAAAWAGAALLLLTPIASAADLPPPPRLSAPELAGHPLAGRIWRAADGAFVSPDQLAAALAGARFVLLGEMHDNPDHHRIQAWAVRALFAAGRRPGLALEMIRADQQEALDGHLRRRPGDAAGLGAALGWSRSGWPAWSLYAPVAARFAREGLAIVGANLPQAALRAVMRDGFAGLGPERARALRLEGSPATPDMLDAMAREIADAHCGQITAQQALPFARAQFARDAALAEGMIVAARASTQDASVLIAGAGHVRTDRGVPWHLARREPGAGIVALAAVEVQGGAAGPRDYAARFGAKAVPFDYVWFTGRVARGDPCAAFRKRK